MGEWNFNRKQCIRALKKLGFVEERKRKGSHDKFFSNFPNSTAPFIMVPRHNQLHCQRAIVKELENMGGVDLVESFKKYL